MAENEQLIYMKKSTYEGALRVINEQLDETAYYKATELEEKIRAIGTRDTLAEYLSGEITDIVYYGDFLDAASFYQNTKIKTFKAPNLTYLPSNCFNDSKIEVVECEKVVNFKGAPFTNCSNLKQIYFPLLQTISGNYTFRYDTSIKKIVLESLKSITGSSNFNGCSSLEVVELNSCKTISGDGHFSGCNLLKEVVIGTPNCTLSNTNIFPSYFLEQGTLWLPDDAIDTYYKTATNWSYFADIMRPVSERSTEVAQ